VLGADPRRQEQLVARRGRQGPRRRPASLVQVAREKSAVG
jgi:hypothetical protein